MTSTNKVLMAILAVQVAVLAFSRIGGGGGMETSTKVTQLFEGLDPTKVTRIEVFGAPKKGDGPDQTSVDLTQVNGQWGIATADGYPADAQKVKDALASLEKLRSRTVVLKNATYHAKLQVAADDFLRKVVVHQDGKARTLFVGSSPSFKNTHVRLDGEDVVYLVNDFAGADLGDRAWGWVDRAYQNIGKDQIWSMRIDNAKGSIQLDKSPTGDWAALGVDQPLAKSTVDDLVRKAGQINLETPVGKTITAAHGLDSPLATVTLVTGTSTIAGMPPSATETVTVKVGAKLEAENQYYVKSSKSDYVVRVAGWAVQPLIDKGRADLIEQPKK